MKTKRHHQRHEPSSAPTTSPHEPAVKRGVIIAVLTLLASLGIGWAADPSAETIGAIATVAGFLVPILQGLWTRFAVTPNAQVLAQVKPSGEVVAGEAAPVTTGAPVAVSVEAVAPPTEPGRGPADLF